MIWWFVRSGSVWQRTQSARSKARRPRAASSEFAAIGAGGGTIVSCQADIALTSSQTGCPGLLLNRLSGEIGVAFGKLGNTTTRLSPGVPGVGSTELKKAEGARPDAGS